MTLTRLLLLCLGPPALVGAAYALSYPGSNRQQFVAAAHLAEAETRSARTHAAKADALTHACKNVALELRPRLPASYRVVVRAPFVLAGDLTEAEFDHLHDEAVVPVTNALWRSFYDRRPNQPVTIVALKDEAGFCATAAMLDGYEPQAYAGYTQRAFRRIVLNLGTGDGTLAHELAHVLALFDFPEMPEWFDEGLAALHESATFSDDSLTMIGMHNWRTRLLCEALRANELPALETVMRTPAFRGEGEGLHYAQVRSFCHYLQDRGLLSHFYRKFRGAVHDDPSGTSTLCELLGASTIDEVDRDFRKWILERSGGP